MSEAWREVARLGKSGEAYHVLADTHGWCLWLGSRRRIDERYYSGLQSLILGLIEHVLRRHLGAGEEIRTLTELEALMIGHLKEAAVMGTELEKKLCTPASLRLVARPEGRCADSAPAEPACASGIAASPPEGRSEAT